MTEKDKTPTTPTKPDGVITTQGNGQTIVAELFFSRSGTETFRDKLLKLILADSLRFSASDGQEPEKTESCDNSRPDDTFPVRRFYRQKCRFPQVKSRGKHPKNAPTA